jgi:hypothetical protein
LAFSWKIFPAYLGFTALQQNIIPLLAQQRQYNFALRCKKTGITAS